MEGVGSIIILEKKPIFLHTSCFLLQFTRRKTRAVAYSLCGVYEIMGPYRLHITTLMRLKSTHKHLSHTPKKIKKGLHAKVLSFIIGK